jgi:sugar O-acyltransferase (sialic acid O-acetyltransferase NeuD family)
MRPLIILGAGGHAKVLIEIIRLRGLDVLGVLDADVAAVGQSVTGIPVIGTDDMLAEYPPQEVYLVNALGSTGSSLQRKDLFTQQKKAGYQFFSLIHPSAVVACDTALGEGVQIMAGAVIQPGCSLGDNSIINTRASVDHDCLIGDHVHIAPGATLSGGVRAHGQAHVGTGAVIIQGVTLGTGCLIAAGAVVVGDVPSAAKVMGVPGKVVDKQ